MSSCIEFGVRTRHGHLRKDTRLQKLYNKYLAKEFVNQNANCHRVQKNNKSTNQQFSIQVKNKIALVNIINLVTDRYKKSDFWVPTLCQIFK